MLNGIKITTDGLIEAVGVDHGADVAGIKAAIDTEWYDLIAVTDTLDLFIDGHQEGPVNTTLTAIMQANGHTAAIHGTGMFLGADPDNGATCALTNAQLSTLVTSYTNATHYWSPAHTEARAITAH